MDNQFSLEMEPFSSSDGWMDCYLVANGQRHALSATSVFPPFQDLLKFTRAIAAHTLPHEFFWDEEGYGALFQAQPAETKNDGSLFRLKVTLHREVIVDADFERMRIVQGLLESLRSVALDCPGAESEWAFPYFLIENFERDLVQGFDLHREIFPISTVNYVFSHCGGYGGTQYPSFDIWVDDRMAASLPMNDNPDFWRTWFSFLENIARTALPAGAVFQNTEENHPDDVNIIMDFGWKFCHRFNARPLADVALFHLEVDWEPDGIGSPRQLISAAFDRRQFVGAFAETFSNFLYTSYPAYLEENVGRFDLRTLPLDKLRQLTN